MHSAHAREDIQEPFVQAQQIDSKKCYPKLLEEWPVEGGLLIPLESFPESLKESMGQAWRTCEKNRRILEVQSEN